MAQPQVAWGSLVRTSLHFEPFSPSVKCGGPEATAAVMFYDSGDGLSACMTDTEFLGFVAVFQICGGRHGPSDFAAHRASLDRGFIKLEGQYRGGRQRTWGSPLQVLCI